MYIFRDSQIIGKKTRFRPRYRALRPSTRALPKVHKSVGGGTAQRVQSLIYLNSAERASHLDAQLYNGTVCPSLTSLDIAVRLSVLSLCQRIMCFFL